MKSPYDFSELHDPCSAAIVRASWPASCACWTSQGYLPVEPDASQTADLKPIEILAYFVRLPCPEGESEGTAISHTTQ